MLYREIIDAIRLVCKTESSNKASSPYRICKGIFHSIPFRTGTLVQSLLFKKIITQRAKGGEFNAVFSGGDGKVGWWQWNAFVGRGGV